MNYSDSGWETVAAISEQFYGSIIVNAFVDQYYKD